MKILIVDDDADILKMIGKLLTHRGHTVSQCATPFGVSALVVREQPDVVVLDMMMPGLSGAALAEIIARVDVPVPPKIVLWSAMEDEQLAETGKRLGLPVVSKTARPSTLLETIEKLFEPKV
jgi:DNA-binding response OmpR family regulator